MSVNHDEEQESSSQWNSVLTGLTWEEYGIKWTRKKANAAGEQFAKEGLVQDEPRK